MLTSQELTKFIHSKKDSLSSDSLKKQKYSCYFPFCRLFRIKRQEIFKTSYFNNNVLSIQNSDLL